MEGRVLMEKNMSKNQKILLQAGKFFVDAKQHDEHEVLGCYRLVVLLCKKLEVTPEGSMTIFDIQQHLNALDSRLRDIVRLRCWENYTRDEIGYMMSISGERVRQLEDQAHKHLYILMCTKQSGNLDQPIEILNLDARAYYGLKRVGVYTIDDLMKVFEKDIFEIKGIGPNVASDIVDKLQAFMMKNDADGQEYFENLPIDVLGFNNRVRYALKKSGVYIVRQFREMSLEEAYRIRGIGKKSFDDIVKKKQELENKRDDSSTLIEHPCLVELNLDPRAMRCIRLLGVKTVQEFLLLTREQVINVWHISEKTWNEIYERQQSLQKQKI